MIAPGATVRLNRQPFAGTKHLVGKTGTVRRVDIETVGGRDQAFAAICFATGNGETAELRDVPAGYLLPVTAADTPKTADPQKPKTNRTPTLKLKYPPDTRTEAQRLTDGAAEIERWGYVVQRIGQGRSPAICHKCSRESRARGGDKFVKINCRNCGSLGYAPSTNSTAGVSDTVVFHFVYPPLVQIPIEWKDAPNGQRTPEQAALEAAGRIVVVWDTPSLVRAIHEFECADPRITPNAMVAAYLQNRTGRTNETPVSGEGMAAV